MFLIDLVDRLIHYAEEDDIMSLATVASLRQHPPASGCQWDHSDQLMIYQDAVLSSWATCERPPQQTSVSRDCKLRCTRGNLCSKALHFESSSLFSSSVINLPRTCSPVHSNLDCLCVWTNRFSFSGARAAEWIPQFSSSCCTSSLHTSWSADGCVTGDRDTNPANNLWHLCCVLGVCVCVRKTERERVSGEGDGPP